MTAVGEPAPERGGAYDYDGPIRFEYRPKLDRDADPGEVVWTWVSFEDDPLTGKDRPVAVVGRTSDERLAVLMLSTKGHDGQSNWTAIGSGPWDKEGRPSWVRRDRVLAVRPDAVRREAAVLPRQTYNLLVSQLRGPASQRPRGVRAAIRRLLGRSR